jgi:O-antigen/teichoic acid export membrane protein
MKKRLQKTKSYLDENLFTNKNAIQTIVKNSFWLLLAEGINKGILFLITILIARHFSVEEYGIFGFVFSLMTLIAMVADFGLSNITIRELAKKRPEAQTFFENTLSLKILLAFVAFALMLVAVLFLDPGIRMLSIFAGTAILLGGMTDHLRSLFRVSEHSQYEAIIKASSALTLLALVGCATFLKLSLIYICAGYILANILGLSLSLRLINQRIRFSLNGLFIKDLVKETWPMFLGLICTTAFDQIDLIFIKAYRGFAEAGLYQAAYKLLYGFHLVGVIHMAMFPRLASLYAGGNTFEYRRVMRISTLSSLIFLIPIGFAATFFPGEIIILVFGPQYDAAATALQFLIWSGITAFICSFFAYTLIISGRQRLWLISVFCALALLLIIDVTLIPRIGFLGAAIGSFAGEVIALIIMMIGIYSNRELRNLFYSRNDGKS